MLTSKRRLEERTGSAAPRLEHLQQLTTQFQDNEDPVVRKQILANLGNFAYDPINYGFFLSLNIVELFLDMLTEDDDELIQFGVCALCNCCVDPRIARIIVENSGIQLLIQCLSSRDEETVLSAIACLILLDSPSTHADITPKAVIDVMERFAAAPNPRLRNLATVFLQDIGSRHH
mmetsp:Transcript_5976/g.13600  ORF Transcript_5976/g.13600 Transcript_5976/m.13600 type:complete len:176 (+) Transcript_5976:50-577(+)